ncbi:MAG: hypothetical protein J0I31_13730 [Rhizobiales bacterium]|nr:hypothetical protein [Hyphomicrobiales bacterium]
MTFFAFANRNGVISFGSHVPSGTLLIADDPDPATLRTAVEGMARHAYDGETLLVPGIPEARRDIDALGALIDFRRRLVRSLSPEART